MIKIWQALPGTKQQAKKLGVNEWRSFRTARKYAKMVNTRYANGSYFKSMAEVFFVEELRKLKTSKHIKGFLYEPEQWEYQYDPQRYVVDFSVVKNDGTTIFIEFKGKMTPDIRKKLSTIKKCNPDKDLHIIFEKGNNKINPRSKTTYLNWAEKNGFKASTKEIEEAWIK